MKDLTLPIVLVTVFFGYWFSKSGKTKRSLQVIRNNVDPHEIPNGKTIYESDIVDSANKEVLRRSMDNYKKAENPAETGVITPLFNTYGKKGQSKETFTDIPIRERAVILDNYKIKNVKQPQNQREVQDRPMFEQFVPELVENVDDKLVRSLLTGKPLESSHNNMIPFFGSSVKQNMETFSNQPLLDLHTGNTSTFKNKNEIEKFFNEQPENIYGSPAFTTQVSTDRYIPSVLKQNELPAEYERIAAPIAGTIDNNIRPKFKTVDQLRTWDNLKETFEGRTIAGQMGDVRGIQASVERRRADTYYEQDEDRYIKTTGAIVGPKQQENFENLKLTSRVETTSDYFGIAKKDLTGDKQRMSIIDTNQPSQNDSYVQEPKRANFENDYSRNLGGKMGSTDYGKEGIRFPETERATTSDKSHLTGVGNTSRGIRTKFSDVPKNTIKETTLEFDNTGNVNSSFNKGRINTQANGMSDYNPKATHKESTIMNNYKGVMNRENGDAYLVTKYDAKTTGKETIHSDYQGTANKNTGNTNRKNYENAEIRDDKQDIISGERPSGPQKFRLTSGKNTRGAVKHTENMALKECTDNRDKKLNSTISQVINNKKAVGVETRWRENEESINRLEPDLVNTQLSKNPYSMYAKK